MYIFLGNDFENITFSVYSFSIEFIWGKLSAVGTVMITTNIILDALQNHATILINDMMSASGCHCRNL